MPVTGSTRTAKPSGYYDQIYEQAHDYRTPWYQSRYAEVWKQVAEAMNEYLVRRILEVGCGTGQLAACLSQKLTLPSDLSYLGIDFSPTAVRLAREMNPGLEFQVKDIRAPRIFGDAVDAVIATEVLEHVDDDIMLLDRIPFGTLVAFSVPNFDDVSHLRYFDTMTDVLSWYAPAFESLDVTWIPLPTTTRFGYWLGIGRR